MTRRICVAAKIDPSELDALKALAEATDRSKSWHIAKAIAAYLQATTPPRKG